MQVENTTKVVFARRLAEQLKEEGVTQEELAGFCGVTQQAVSGWLNGKMPGGGNLYKICQRLNVSAAYLLGVEGEHRKAAKREADRATALLGKAKGQEVFDQIIQEQDASATRESIKELSRLIDTQLANSTTTPEEYWRLRAVQAEEELAKTQRHLEQLAASINSTRAAAVALEQADDAVAALRPHRASPPKPQAAAPSGGKASPGRGVPRRSKRRPSTPTKAQG